MKETVKGLISYAAVGGALVVGMLVGTDMYNFVNKNINKLRTKIKTKREEKRKAQ